ncbi:MULTISPECIES: S8 family serine peptidase [Streptosporangium]|uniref:Subtilisin family serine protease n=1 Tax=Streptosporangium brasiliense TaxID=47480 RepID=A0ABT9R630_9ACTN|nr:S8 family serine peptidase [Streptosporangium brasiliense]MDP9864321.1 subtilisin family serine protease [Streptosporangium brasiliense]
MTLLTGDRVIVTGKGHRVEPGPGRRVRYATQRRDGHLLVFPSDAMPLVAEGVLDERLFDVTQLLEWRYGDADRADIPVIAQSAQGAAPALRAARQTRQLAHLDMTALHVPKAGAGETWKDLIAGSRTLVAEKTRFWLDGRRSFALDQSVKQIGATEAWKQGLTGKGVTVAVLDSGYDADHPDLKDVVTQTRNFTDSPDMRDVIGHGTHVASIIAGAGEKYRGVAPDAKLAVGKVGDDWSTDSAVLAGMEWAAVDIKAKIINMSLGGKDTPELDLLEQAVNTLSAQTGALFVVAAGNSGDLDTVNSPGSADAALSVGAVDRSDRIAEFSSHGPRAGDHAIKPDITAPGVEIVAAAAKGTADGPYVAHSGTSMAAPHVAGAAAILAQRHPNWTGERLRAALIGTAKPTADVTPYRQGAGRVDLVRALTQPVVAVPGNVWALFPWQDSGTRETTRTITYTNSGDAPAILDLAIESDVLRLSAKRLEVPAGGEASVTLTINADGKAPGDYPGIVTARSGDTVIRTLAGAYVEPKSYDVTITAISRDGRPATASGQAYNLETGSRLILPFKNGVAKARLPEGQWNLYAELVEQSTIAITIANVPLKVDGGDREVVLDARQAKQIRFSLDEPTAVPDHTLELALANGSWNFQWIAGGDPNENFFVLPVHQPGLRYMTRTIWHKKEASPSPYRYDLVDYRTGGIPDDPYYRARTSDLVKLTATYRASGVAAKGEVFLGPRFPGSDSSMMSPTPATDLPGTMTHYRTLGFTWDSQFQVGTFSAIGTDRYSKASPRREVWNAAVTGPAFTTSGGGRTGNELSFAAPQLFTDGVTGRTGTDTSATGTVTLAKGDEMIAETDLTDCADREPCLTAELPAEASTYTLTAAARRQVPYATLSTAVDAVWTFRSASTAKPQPLPLMAVRYAPVGLDDSNRAKPGSLTRLPIWIERNPGAFTSAVKSVKLEASFNDGATWRPVPLHPTSSGWTALLTNPGTPGFVSLRATATDAADDSVTQTVNRAYAVG